MIKNLKISEIQKNFDADADIKDYFFPPKGRQPKILNPYRISSYAIGLYHEGEVKLNADLRTFEIKPKSLIILPPNTIREWMFYDSSPINSVLFFSKEFILEHLSEAYLSSKFTFLKHKKMEVLNLNDTSYVELSTTFEDLLQQSRRISKNQRKIICLKIAVLLYLIDEIYQEIKPALNQSISRPQLLVNNFLNLILENFLSERGVKFYAEKLFISPKYLSQIVFEQTGRKASEIIREKIIVEAKVLLRNPEVTINEVSFSLKFSTATQFGKYFKKYTGMSPTVYRNQSKAS